MKAKTFNSESLEYFLSLAKDIIPETKDFLFLLMEEIARQENIPLDYKEDRIYFTSHLHSLLSGIEREILEAEKNH